MSRLISILVLCLVAVSNRGIVAQDQIDTAFVLPRDHHAWGRFEEGAWKKVRVTTETLNEQGDVIGTSVADTLIKLTSVDEKGYSLLSETTISIAGRQMGKQVTTIWQGFSGEHVDDEVSGRIIRPASVQIDSMPVNTQVREFVFRCNSMRRVASVNYSPSISPHVLEAHTVATDPSGKSVKYRTDIEVVSLNHKVAVLEETLNVAKVRTQHQTPKTRVTTLELFSEQVPGGIVASESEEHDLSGRAVSRSSLELLEYSTSSEEQSTQLFSGGRFFRKNRSR